MFKRSKDKADSAGGSQAQGRPQDHFTQANDWEASRTLMLERSERRAWGFAWLAAAMFVMSVVAIVLMLPLKERVPYIVKESATGQVTMLTRLAVEDLSYEEARDKHWVGRYVAARQRYNWTTLQDDYDFVSLLSAPNVDKEYKAGYEGDDALDKKLGNRTLKKVQVLSVVPSENGTATVRFQVETAPVDGGAGQMETWIATVAYKYVPGRVQVEDKRQLNPYGFTVTSYRIDPESFGGGN